MGRLRSIQILRALAIFGVLALHVMERWSISTGRPLPPSAHIGAYGVDLFFVISGFIVCMVATRASSAANFLRDRFVRVAPLYYLMTIPWLRFAAALGTLTPAAIATSLFFWPAWGSTPTYPALTAGWTLCLEALFYCSLGAIVQFRRRAAVVLALGYTVALVLNLAGAPGVVQYIGSPLLAEFLLGAAIALRPIRPRPRAGAAAVLLAGLLLGAWCAFGIGETWNGLAAYAPDVALPRAAIAGPPAFLLVWGALQLEPWCKGRLADVLGHIGDASYSIYLTHSLTVALVAKAWNVAGMPKLGLAPVTFVGALAYGLLVYRLMERPLLAVLRRRPQPISVAAE